MSAKHSRKTAAHIARGTYRPDYSGVQEFTVPAAPAVSGEKQAEPTVLVLNRRTLRERFGMTDVAA